MYKRQPNGYLHIGSAKAIYINWSIANQYGGKFNLRLDDTNPAREGEEYVNSIIEDLHWLGACLLYTSSTSTSVPLAMGCRATTTLSIGLI